MLKKAKGYINAEYFFWEATIYLTKEHLSENKNRFNVDPDDLARLLKQENFVLDSSTDYTTYYHNDHHDLKGKFPRSKSTLPNTYVKSAYEAMEEASDRKVANNQDKNEPIKLPDFVAADVEAVLKGKHATFSYKIFPEFQTELTQTDLGDTALMRSIGILQRDFRETFNRVQYMQNEYGVEVIRTPEDIILRQPVLNIEQKFDRNLVARTLAGQIMLALNKIRESALDYQQGRQVQIYLLTDRGYEVEEKKGTYVVKDPRNSEASPIEISTDFSSLARQETIDIMLDLEKRYPVQKKAPTLTAPIAAETAKIDAETRPLFLVELQVGQILAEPKVKKGPAPKAIDIAVPYATPIIETVLAAKTVAAVSVPIAETPAPRFQEIPLSQPAVPTLRTGRPSHAIFAVVQPESSGEESLYELMTRLRNERHMTEEDVADGLKNIDARAQRQKVVFSDDLIEEWQRNKSFPNNRQQWDIACQVLIRENIQIPDGEKEKEIVKYGYAKDESLALFKNTPNKVKSEDFGIFTSRYRRQLGWTEAKLAEVFTERLSTLQADSQPTENVAAMDYQDISRIQLGVQKTSPGLTKYLICLFSQENKAKDIEPLSDEDKAALQTALENVPAPSQPAAKSSATRSSLGPSEVKPEARALRAELLAMFRDNTGKPMTLTEVVTLGQALNPTFSYSNVSNYLSESASHYHPLSSGKAAEIKDILSKVLDVSEGNPLRQEFSQRFDQLTEIFQEQKRLRASQIAQNRGKTTLAEGPSFD